MKRKRKKDHAGLICDIGELSDLFTDSTSLESFLQKIVAMVAEHMHSDVCSIYLFNEEKNEIVLKATTGLNSKFIGNLKMKLGEGLTGLALQRLMPICERQSSRNPNFRYFPGLGEELYESFLVVPIIRGNTRIGAIVIQNTEMDFFSDEDIKTMRAITSQLANTIETTRLILSIEEAHDIKIGPNEKKDISVLKGKVGARGFAYGPVIVLSDQRMLQGYSDKVLNKKYSLKNFQTAVKETERQLDDLQKQIEEKLSDVASLIFTAQILMLKDKTFIDNITNAVGQGVNPPDAIINTVKHYVAKFEAIPNAYFRDKSHDVHDIGRRLINNLIGEDKNKLSLEGKIVVARGILPSDVLKLSSQKVKGIILLSGGITSHISILSQSLQLPLMIADVEELLQIPEDSLVLMDARDGKIYVDPPKDVVQTIKAREKTFDTKKLKQTVKKVTKTRDGAVISLMANINLIGDLKMAREFQAEGVGLYRSEFPFVVRNDFPSEEEQFVIYKKLVEGIKGKEITFRTLDIGGDKVLSYFEHHMEEKNPYMGMRSIRFSLKHIDIFAQQIRAILRAGAGSSIRIMFPMISSCDEFSQAREVVTSCITNLKKENIVCQEQPKIGLMVELPAVLEIIDDLAKEADFFSIGTNDFIQYMLAVDRSNEKVADLYLPYHPAILRGLNRVVQSAINHNIDVSLCGDMSHQKEYLSFLLGIGLRKFSLDSLFIPRIQSAIRKISLNEAREKAQAILGENSLVAISRLLELG